jgi:hypothetical protein
MSIADKIKEIIENPTFLFGLNSLSDEKKEKYEKDFYKTNPKPKPKFDQYGLRYDISYLNNLGNNVLLSPVEYISNYVDIITKNLVDTNDYIFIQDIKRSVDIEKYKLCNINATACGNMAYVYLNTKDEYVKDYMKRNLLNLHIWKLEEMSQYIKDIQN